MATKKNLSGLLETVEEGQNKVSYVKSVETYPKRVCMRWQTAVKDVGEHR